MTDKFDLLSFFATSKHKIANVIARIVPGNDVEDILQETYIKAHRVEFNSEIREPTAFVMQIAKNLALDHIKSAEFKRLSFVDKETIENLINQDNSSDPVLNDLTHQEDLQHFIAAVQSLPKKCQEVYMLKKIYGYSQKEIAERLGVTVSSVEKHIAYGTKKLFHLIPIEIETERSSKKNRVRLSIPKREHNYE